MHQKISKNETIFLRHPIYYFHYNLAFHISYSHPSLFFNAFQSFLLHFIHCLCLTISLKAKNVLYLDLIFHFLPCFGDLGLLSIIGVELNQLLCLKLMFIRLVVIKIQIINMDFLFLSRYYFVLHGSFNLINGVL